MTRTDALLATLAAGVALLLSACPQDTCPPGTFRADDGSGCITPLPGDDDVAEDDDDSVVPDDDDSSADDDDGVDDDDSAPTIELTAGEWLFEADRVVLTNSCAFVANPHQGLAGFELTSLGADIYDLDQDDGTSWSACQAWDVSFNCPAVEVPWDDLSETNAEVTGRLLFGAVIDGPEQILAVNGIELDCEGSACATVEAAISAEFPCEFSSRATALWSPPGDDDDIGPDDDDIGPDDDDTTPPPDDDDTVLDDDDTTPPPDDDDTVLDDDDTTPPPDDDDTVLDDDDTTPPPDDDDTVIVDDDDTTPPPDDDDTTLPPDDDDTVIIDDDDTVIIDDDDTAPMMPNIIPVSIDGPIFPVSLQQGDNLDVGYHYANTGTAPASLSSVFPLVNRVHLCTGTTAASSVEVVAVGQRTSDMSPGQTSFLAINGFQVTSAPGTYNLVFQVDATDVVVEADEADNELLAGVVTVTPNTSSEICGNGIDDDFDGDEDCEDSDCQSLPICQPDIVPDTVTGTTFPASVEQDDTTPLGYSYSNDGGGPTTNLSSANPMTNGIHLSTSADIADSVALILTATRTSDLSAGQGSSLSPVNTPIYASPGVYQVILEVDIYDSVAEADENNNWVWVGQMTVTPP